MHGAPYDIEHRIVVCRRCEMGSGTGGGRVRQGRARGNRHRHRSGHHRTQTRAGGAAPDQSRAPRAEPLQRGLDPRDRGIRLARSGLPHHRRRGGLSLLLGGPRGTRRGEDRDGRGAGRCRRRLSEGRRRDLGRHRPWAGTDRHVHPGRADTDREGHGHRSGVCSVAGRGAETRVRLDHCDSARRRWRIRLVR